MAGPDFFPDSLPASCGALAPFRLCSDSQPQSSTWDLTSSLILSSQPPPARQVSRQASQAGECCSAPILCVGISPLCPLHPCCCALLRGSEASPHPPSPTVKGLPSGGNFSSFTAPSRGAGSRPYSFFFFLIFYLFIYFWLCWVFVSVRGLSLVAASGGHSSSQCVGLSLSRPLLLRSTGSRRAGSVIVAHRPSCSTACGILPDQGSNLCPLH